MSGALPPATIDAALAAARRAGVDRLDALALLAEVTTRPRSWLQAHGEAPLDVEAAGRWTSLLHRRAEGEPLAYLLGRKEFFGLDLRVTPEVLVPRPDTETLVEWALELLSPTQPARVLDLGTGSGAIALALASQRPLARITAVDASTAALAMARANGAALELTVEWLHSDWFSALGARQFDLIVSNPPYLAAADPHLPALRHEPLAALVSGEDGLADLRHLAAAAPAHLARGGWLLLEHGCEQAGAVARCLQGADWTEHTARRDLAGRPRCSGARRRT